MNNLLAFLFSLIVALSSAQWREMGAQWQGQGRMAQSGSQWGEQGRINGPEKSESRGQWSMQGGQGRSLQGGSTGDGRYGVINYIDTPEMYGYEARIPGATSRFVGYRNARGGAGGRSDNTANGQNQDRWPEQNNQQNGMARNYGPSNQW